METTSLIERQELKDKADRLYTPPEIIELFKSTGIGKDWSFIEYKASDTSKLTHCYLAKNKENKEKTCFQKM